MFNRKKVKALAAEVAFLKGLVSQRDILLDQRDKMINQLYDVTNRDLESNRLLNLKIEVLTRTSEIKKEKVKEPKLVAKDLKTGKFIKKI